MPSCTGFSTSHPENVGVSSWSGGSSLAASASLDYETTSNFSAYTVDGESDRDNDHQLLYYATQNLALASWIWLQKHEFSNNTPKSASCIPANIFQPLKSVRHWLDSIHVQDRHLAHLLCKLIPSQCPFERDIVLFGKTILHIPPLCKLNPFYNEVVYLRFRAMSYLADECGEDVSVYSQGA